MEKLILFILATAGLSWILCRSKLFKSTREYISSTYDEVEVKKKFGKAQPFSIVFWFLSSLFGCVGCMGFWAAQPVYIIIYGQVSLNQIVYGFIGSIVSLIIIDYSLYLGRK